MYNAATIHTDKMRKWRGRMGAYEIGNFVTGVNVIY